MQLRRHGSLFAGLLLASSAAVVLDEGAALAATTPLTPLSSSWILPVGGPESGSAPALTRALNGDIVMSYSTGLEDSDAAVRVRRSADQGVTWTPYVQIFTGSAGVNGNAAVGMTTLADGTILLPFTAGRVYQRYTNRETDTYVARSTDNGVTWTGTTTPISLPAPWNGADVLNATYGRIVDLGGGVLLMPVFGTSTQTPLSGPTNAPLSNPVPYQAGVFRSLDNGLTWSSYARIGVDDNSQVLYYNLNGKLPTAVSEPTVTRLRDGRLMALLRYETVLQPHAYFVSYSSDSGVTWSDPVKTPLIGRTGTLDQAPCSSDLPSGRSKLIVGYLDFNAFPKLAIRQSFDDGAQWRDPVYVQRPAGSPTTGHDYYPDFLELPGNKLLVVYTANIPGVGLRLASQTFQDTNAAACNADLTSDDSATSATPAFFVKSGDWSGQSWNYSSRHVVGSSTTALSVLIAAHAQGVGCSGAGVQAYEDGVQLNPSLSFAANQLTDGDTIELRGPIWSGFTTAGYADADGGWLSPGPVLTADPSVQHKLMGFPKYCDYRAALDYHGRSIGARFTVGSGQMVTGIHFRDSDGSWSIPASAFTVWKSPDNRNWFQVPFSLSTTTEAGSGRSILHFTGINTAGPYLKVNVNYMSPSGYQVIIDSMRADVWVTCNVAGNGCAAT
ncbi:sialidase family protein [Jiangella anatolica]|nr:sialidase family protein [Jiangella anatolica]